MMKRYGALFLLLQFLLCAQVYEIKAFESDIFSKKGNNLKQISLSLTFEGKFLEKEEHKIADALNIVISSFYLEDLFTSKGKEQFKKSLIAYLAKKYAITVEALYLDNMKRLTNDIEIDALVKALKEQGYCQQKTKSAKKVFDTIEQ